jgi:hypothetical protein
MISVRSSKYSLTSRNPGNPTPFFFNHRTYPELKLKIHFLNISQALIRKFPFFLIVRSLQISSFPETLVSSTATPFGSFGAAIASRTVNPSRV